MLVSEEQPIRAFALSKIVHYFKVITGEENSENKEELQRIQNLLGKVTDMKLLVSNLFVLLKRSIALKKKTSHGRHAKVNVDSEAPSLPPTNANNNSNSKNRAAIVSSSRPENKARKLLEKAFSSSESDIGSLRLVVYCLNVMVHLSRSTMDQFCSLNSTSSCNDVGVSNTNPDTSNIVNDLNANPIIDSPNNVNRKDIEQPTTTPFYRVYHEEYRSSCPCGELVFGGFSSYSRLFWTLSYVMDYELSMQCSQLLLEYIHFRGCWDENCQVEIIEVLEFFLGSLYSHESLLERAHQVNIHHVQYQLGILYFESLLLPYASSISGASSYGEVVITSETQFQNARLREMLIFDDFGVLDILMGWLSLSHKEVNLLALITLLIISGTMKELFPQLFQRNLISR